MKSILQFVLIVTLLSGLVSGQRRECNDQRIRRLLADPPSDWSINKMNRREINNFICSRQLVGAAVSCIENPDNDKCQDVKGLGNLVEAVMSNVNRDYSCDNCDGNTMNLLQHAVKTVQRRFPREYNRALASFY